MGSRERAEHEPLERHEACGSDQDCLQVEADSDDHDGDRLETSLYNHSTRLRRWGSAAAGASSHKLIAKVARLACAFLLGVLLTVYYMGSVWEGGQHATSEGMAQHGAAFTTTPASQTRGSHQHTVESMDMEVRLASPAEFNSKPTAEVSAQASQIRELRDELGVIKRKLSELVERVGNVESSASAVKLLSTGQHLQGSRVESSSDLMQTSGTPRVSKRVKAKPKKVSEKVRNVLYPYIFPITPCLHEDAAQRWIAQSPAPGESPIPLIETCNPVPQPVFTDELESKLIQWTRPDLPNTAPFLTVTIPTVLRWDNRTTYLKSTLKSLLGAVESYFLAIHEIRATFGLITNETKQVGNAQAKQARKLVDTRRIAKKVRNQMREMLESSAPNSKAEIKLIEELLNAPTVFTFPEANETSSTTVSNTSATHPVFPNVLRSPIPPGTVPAERQYSHPLSIHIHVVAFTHRYPHIPPDVQEALEFFPPHLFPYLHFHVVPLELSENDDPGDLPLENWEKSPMDSSLYAWRAMETLLRSPRYQKLLNGTAPKGFHVKERIRRQSRHFTRLLELFVSPEKRHRPEPKKVLTRTVAKQILPYVRSRFGLLLEDDFGTCGQALPVSLSLLAGKLDHVGDELARATPKTVFADYDNAFARVHPPLQSHVNAYLTDTSFRLGRRWLSLKATVGGSGLHIHTARAYFPRLTANQWMLRAKRTESFAERMADTPLDAPPPAEIYESHPSAPWVVYQRRTLEGMRDLFFPRSITLDLQKHDGDLDVMAVTYPKGSKPLMPPPPSLPLIYPESVIRRFRLSRAAALYREIDDAEGFAKYAWAHQQRRPIDHLMEEYFMQDSLYPYFIHGGPAERPSFYTVFQLFDHQGVVSAIRSEERPQFACAEYAVDSRHTAACYHDSVAPCLPRDTLQFEDHRAIFSNNL